MDLKTPGSGGFDAQSTAALTITQPLLRGYGADIVREPLTQAERDVLYAARRYERYRRTLAYDVTSRFFGILRLMDTLQNEQENYERRRLLRERNEAFAEAGQLDEIELGQARQDELRAQNSVIVAQRELDTALDDFKLFLGLPIEAELPLDPSDYLSLGRWSFLDLNPAEQDVIRVALGSRLDYLTQRELVEDAARKVTVAEDALRAGLDLVAGADAVSELGDPGNLSGDDVTWSASLALDLPFDRLPERNAYRATLIGLERALRSADESADTIVADLRDELRTLASARQSYEIQTVSVELALRRVESTELKLEAGRAETRDVLESQDSLLTARNTATAALTTYILSGLALYRDMELLRVTPEGVTVDTEPLFSAALDEDLP
jgi:outer membrane protein TolC